MRENIANQLNLTREISKIDVDTATRTEHRSGVVSIVADRKGIVVDRHFRSGSLQKTLLLMLKLAFLALPNARQVIAPDDFTYI